MAGKQMRHHFWFYVLSTVFVLCCGCASYPVNPPLEHIDDNAGYRMLNRTLGEKNSDELFVILSLSGGGTRAIALDYGVLKYLDKIKFGSDDRSLLDEVDLISSSSASSIPAAYYGLFGQETFLNDFAQDVLSYEALDKRPYIHLLDSGVSDNIGIRTPQLVFRVAGQIDRVMDGTIKKLVVIMVDAKSKSYFKGDLKAKPPGAITSIYAAATRPLDNYSYETVNLIKRNVRDARNLLDQRRSVKNTCDDHARSLCEQVAMGADCLATVSGSCLSEFGVTDDKQSLEFDIYLIHVSFESIEDRPRREGFQSIPTTLQLPPEQIDSLIAIAPELLHEDPEFSHLLRDLGAQITD